MRRIFIAVPLLRKSDRSFPELSFELSKYSSLIKAVEPRYYHLTLKFFGSVEEDLCDRIISSFNGLSADFSPVAAEIKGLGCFPNTADPSVIWAGIRGADRELSVLHRLTEDFASGFGFSPETRPFSPHLTLGRVRRGRRLPLSLRNYIRDNGETFYGKTLISEVVLYESKLKPEGPEYYEIAKIELK